MASPLFAAAEPAAAIYVRLRLADLSGQPLAGAPVRLVIALGPDWQRPEAGAHMLTDKAGMVHWTTSATPGHRRIKLPTNFISQLFSLPQRTTQIAVGIELSYMGRRWLAVGSGDYFENGATMMHMSVYGPDAAGNFTILPTRNGDSWSLPGIEGAQFQTNSPGFRLERLSLTPKEGTWSVDMSIQLEPEPVMR